MQVKGNPHFAHIRQTLKDWMLPIAMAGGVIFYKWMYHLVFLSPYLIFCMLTVTYCRLEMRDFKIGKFQWVLMAVQLLFSGIVYFALLPMGSIVATGVFICVFVGPATAAPVITSMLGGSITKVATYTLLYNVVLACVCPAILAAVGVHPDMSFIQSFYKICATVMPLLLLPIITALILRYTWRPAHDWLAHSQSLGFYMWALALFIVVGTSVSFIINHFDINRMPTIISLLIGSAVVCGMQFWLGRKVGAHFNDKVSGGQSLGQKNTVLAIWLALAYLDPIASIGPAAYVAWHNIVNSYQIMHYHHKHSNMAKS